MKLPAPITEPARMPYFLRNTSATGVSAASFSSALNSFNFFNASSAASFTALPLWKSEREPSVAMSNGVTSVSECTTVTASVGSRSTSAAICAMAVSDPCPMSTARVDGAAAVGIDAHRGERRGVGDARLEADGDAAAALDVPRAAVKGLPPLQQTRGALEHLLERRIL